MQTKLPPKVEKLIQKSSFKQQEKVADLMKCYTGHALQALIQVEGPSVTAGDNSDLYEAIAKAAVDIAEATVTELLLRGISNDKGE